MKAVQTHRRAATEGAPRTQDRLPPHSTEAEQGVLGCVLLAPEECLAECEARFAAVGFLVFYDLRHQALYRTLTGMREDGTPIDLITVPQRLKDHGHMEDIGGLAYLSTLPDTVPSAANLSYYLDIVWEKYLLRKVVQTCAGMASRAMEDKGEAEALLDQVKADIAAIGSTQRSTAPLYLRTPADFFEGFFQEFFGGGGEEPGQEIPVLDHVKLKIRPQETTLVSGDNGSGKSTVLNYLALHLAAQGEKVLIASLEMRPQVILKILACQLMGRRHMQDCQADRDRVSHALSWLSSRFLLYDFTGIADWRDLLDTFAYASSKKGMTVAILDSIMRIGIPDDDYAQQGLAASRFAQATKDGNYHLFQVIHENKGDGKGKEKIRGSKQWTDNPDNILQVRRNADKGEKVDKIEWQIEQERASRSPDRAEMTRLEGELEKLRRGWDTNVILRKQRWPGARQNGSTFCWFDRESFQFRARWEDGAVNWLEQWKPRKEK